MWNDLSLSREEIARRMKISSLSVTNTAHRLNFPMNTPGTRISNDKAHRKPPRRTLSETRENCRKKWRKVLKENPEANWDKLIKLAALENSPDISNSQRLSGIRENRQLDKEAERAKTLWNYPQSDGNSDSEPDNLNNQLSDDKYVAPLSNANEIRGLRKQIKGGKK